MLHSPHETQKMFHHLSPRAVVLAVLLCAARPAAAQSESPSWMRGLDDLMSLEVTSVSKKEQRLADTSAAVYVLTREDIRRSGLRTVANLLRLVPGVHVAQLDGSRFAVSSRGMGGILAKHLLVMIDGRSIYTPYFAGVFWDAVDVPVEMIERIEVIRGPGASIWGANAVNGVINIITTSDTVRRETAVTGAVGSAGFGTIVHGGRISDLFGYRLFGNATEHQPFDLPDGGDANDRRRERSAGGSFRGTLNARDTLEGSLRAFASQANYVSDRVTDLAPYTVARQPVRAETETWNASLRWTRQLTGGGDLQAEGWTDAWWREDEAFDHRRRSAGLSFQYRLGARRGHDLIGGSAYQATSDTSRGGLWMRLDPESDRHSIVSAFVEDDIRLVGGRANLVLGTKVEHRDHIGWHAQPTARLHWRFTPTRSAWVAASRAMRAPDRVEQDAHMNAFGWPMPDGSTAVFSILGNVDAEPEWLTALEAGYRTALRGALTLDLAAFRNRYEGLQTFVGEPPTVRSYQGRTYLEFPLRYANLLSVETAGGEASAVYAPVSVLKLTGSYSLFSYKPEFVAPAIDYGTDGGATPRHQGQIRLGLTLPREIDADVALFAKGAMPKPAFDTPAHARIDARVAWRPASPVELSVVVQNLANQQHPENAGWAAYVKQPSRRPRSAYTAVTWKF